MNPPTERRLLVVDDDYTFVDYLRMVLSPIGWHVDTCLDPLEATDLLRRQTPHVIMVDYVMPKMTGLELLTWLRDRPETRDVPVVVCSVNMDRKLSLEAASLGASRTIPKPVNRNDLLECLQHVLQPH